MGSAAEMPASPFFKIFLWGEYITLGCFFGSSLSMSWVKSVKSVKSVLCLKLYSFPNTDFM